MKHVPLRTCVACRTERPKRELVRIVRVTPTLAEVDTTGKKNGRGSYLCPAQECWHLAEKKGALNRALEMNVTSDNWKTLWTYAEGLPETKVLKRSERAAVEAASALGREEQWDAQGNSRGGAAQPPRSPSLGGL
jgi:predicted RNA-binding protein YlxR (DUF448 family)